jgi:hypothetical protein
MAAARFSFPAFLLRALFGTALVLVTWNPSGHSFFHWAMTSDSGNRAFVALAGVTLLILFVIYIRATFRAMGTLGIVLAAAFLGALVWVLVDTGILTLEGGTAPVWAAQICLGILLGIGMSWSHVRRALTGQVDVDDVDE